MSDKTCLQFDPQWTTVNVGESIIWRSGLKTPVTIHVSPGVFSKTSYRVRPGAMVSSGPARNAGSYAFWTEPTACQDMPLGVLIGAPGVRVQERLLASAETR